MRAIGASLAGLALGLSAPLNAQAPLETRKVTGDVESPAATAEQLDWLVGSWAGPGVRGETAMESWTSPVGGTMVGTFIQTNADGSIMFTELMYIRPVGESLEIAIKHFNPDLTGWEEKGEVERFRLVGIEECAAYFQTLTIRCADENAPDKGIVVAVRAGTDDAGKVKELVFRYGTAREDESVGNAPCEDAVTTLDINQCYAAVLARADQRRLEYASSAINREKDRPELVAKIRSSERAFEAYRQSECDAVYEDWKEGTIRGFMSLTCRIEMTDRRTKVIWQNWLTYMDSTPPILPEPKPSM